MPDTTTKTTPGPVPKEQARDHFIQYIQTLVRMYPTDSAVVAHGILCIFDGVAGSLPAFDITIRPHPDDKAYCEAQGDDWYVDGQVINDDVHLHDLLKQ